MFTSRTMSPPAPSLTSLDKAEVGCQPRAGEAMRRARRSQRVRGDREGYLSVAPPSSSSLSVTRGVACGPRTNTAEWRAVRTPIYPAGPARSPQGPRLAVVGGHIDPCDRVLAACPGSLAQMVSVSSEMGANSIIVAAVHLVRLGSVLLVAPSCGQGALSGG
jgi:hypothetical protein